MSAGQAMATGAAAGAAGGPVAAGIGAIGGLASTIIGGKISGKNSAKAAAAQYQYNLALQQQAQQWNEYMYKHRYQFQVDDLEKAGINKLYGLGTAPSVTSGTNSIGMPDTVGEANNRSERIMQGINTIMDWSAKRAQIKNVEQQTKTEERNTLLKQYEALNAEYDAILKKKEINGWDEKRLTELNNMKSDTMKKLAEVGEVTARTGTARAQTKQIEEETKETERINQFYKEHPKLGKMVTASKELKALADLVIGGTKDATQAYNNVQSARKTKQEYEIKEEKRRKRK